ncbi:hypothetical protein N9F71_00220 [bacterium]|jgi:hypothetical protein|nr:hypothetical protein [bacterium]|tara:strand:- start:13964 stop:14284 length:321 start_codon:yes stop_codon:yes gene_type:complete
MADKKVTALTAATSVSSDDLFMVVDNPGSTPSSKKVTVQNLFGAVPSDLAIVAGKNLRLTSSTPSTNNPTTTSPTVGAGSIWFDADYIYVAVSATVIKRAALSDIT